MAALLFVSLLCAACAGSFSVSAAETKERRSFSSRVVELEALLQEENETVAFMASAVEAAPAYQPGGETGPTKDQFISDLVNSYNARCSVLSRYSEFPTISEDGYNMLRFLCTAAERPFYDAYQGAVFEDRNIGTLCGEYLPGLEKQYEAEALGSSDEIEAAYFEGYDIRSAALIEAGEFYMADKSVLADYDSLTASLNMAVIVPAAVEKNKAEADKTMCVNVQNNLNTLGFACGTADGIAGKNTVLAICHFQMASGLPVDGIVDAELDAQVASQVPAAPESQAAPAA